MFAAWSPCEQKGLHAQQPGPLCQGPQGQRQPVCSLGRNLEPGRDEEKSGSQEEKQKKNQTLKHILNLTPTPASVRSEPTTTPVIPTSPESQNNPNTPFESEIPGRDSGEKAGAGNLAPAPKPRPEPAQDELHPDLNKINQ